MSEETNRGKDPNNTLSNKSHCDTQDWLMTYLIRGNSGRSGIVANVTTRDFKVAISYPGTDEDQACYRVQVKNYKTTGVYGVIWSTMICIS